LRANHGPLRRCASAIRILSARRDRLAKRLRDPLVHRGPVLGVHSVPRGEEADTGAIVYSEEQARTGYDLYNVHCASCHGVSLEGQGSLPLSGATFRARWADDHHSVDDLFYIIRTLMPYGQPATLSKQEYIDIIAYILMVNGYPAGTQPLPSDPRTLKRITIRTQQP
jgi:mono/diheme cytochrome c family protein